jgi:hypothetical protein
MKIPHAEQLSESKARDSDNTRDSNTIHPSIDPRRLREAAMRLVLDEYMIKSTLSVNSNNNRLQAHFSSQFQRVHVSQQLPGSDRTWQNNPTTSATVVSYPQVNLPSPSYAHGPSTFRAAPQQQQQQQRARSETQLSSALLPSLMQNIPSTTMVYPQTNYASPSYAQNSSQFQTTASYPQFQDPQLQISPATMSTNLQNNQLSTSLYPLDSLANSVYKYPEPAHFPTASNQDQQQIYIPQTTGTAVTSASLQNSLSTLYPHITLTPLYIHDAVQFQKSSQQQQQLSTPDLPIIDPTLLQQSNLLNNTGYTPETSSFNPYYVPDSIDQLQQQLGISQLPSNLPITSLPPLSTPSLAQCRWYPPPSLPNAHHSTSLTLPTSAQTTNAGSQCSGVASFAPNQPCNSDGSARGNANLI